MAGAGLRRIAAPRWLTTLEWPPRQGLLAGWAGLGRFWVAVVALLGLGAAGLQFLAPRHLARPPRSDHPVAQSEARPDVKPTEKVAAASVGHTPPAKDAKVEPIKPGRAIPGPVNDPDPALLEPDTESAHAFLPRISPDGRAPMHEYAAGFDISSRLVRVGILVAGIGMNDADSSAATRRLPAGVTLGVSPYATNVDRLLASARIAEHEYLLSIPMEPQGFPANDPDDRHALMTSLAPTDNLTRLHWAMSRFAGYAGVTNALGQMGGERLSGMAEQLEPVLEDVAGRGLFFVDARPGQPVLRLAWNRSVDVVIDEAPVNEASLDARLEALAKAAKDKGSALGLVVLPRPVTVDRVVAWTNTLRDRGFTLAPVSALVGPPPAQEQDK